MLDQSLLWLWTTTWQSAILALLVFVVIHLLRNRLQPRWQYAFWCIVLLRLAMPFLPSTPWGVWGSDVEVQVETAQLPSPETFGDAADAAFEPTPDSTEDFAAQAPVASPEEVNDPLEPDQAKEATTWQTYATRSLFIIWLCGVACLAARQLSGEYRLWRMRRCWKRVEDPEILNSFETCRERAGVRFSVGLYTLPDALGAGSCGWLRPSVLLSEATLAQLSTDQLKLVLMHELFHHRRRNPLLQRIGLWLSVIHWFNPVMWLTLRQLGKYRETACDAAVLDRLGQRHQKEYGQVVLDFATGLAAARPIPGLVGVFQKNGIKKRIEMIVNHKKSRWHHLALGTSLLLLLTMFGLTKADRAPVPTAEESETITSEKVASPTSLKAKSQKN